MTVVVIGATGALGARVVEGLLAADGPVRTCTRRPLADPPAGVDARLGDLGDPESLAAAFAGADCVFLVSSPTPDQVGLETNAIEAAERAGCHRVVKVANIPIVGLETGLHGNHRAIERRLAASPLDAVVLQPSFFTSVIARQAELLARGILVLPTGPGRIAWIEPDDIAAVAVAALTRDDLTGPLHLTGPEALDGDEVAARLGVRRLDPAPAEWRDGAVASGLLDPWLADSTVHLYEAVARGALAAVTDTVERVLGRPPRRAFGGSAPEGG